MSTVLQEAEKYNKAKERLRVGFVAKLKKLIGKSQEVVKTCDVSIADLEKERMDAMDQVAKEVELLEQESK